MCRTCRCSDFCGCNTTCCCGFKIPIDVGYIFCCCWLLFNAFTFPVISFIFWPRRYIFWVSCVICSSNLLLVLIALVNYFRKNHKLFNIVFYGVAALYLAGGLFITISVDADRKGSSVQLRQSFRTFFGASVHPSIAFGLLQRVQIMFYFYLFVSYVYSGFVLQQFEIVHSKWYGMTRWE